MRPSFKRIFLRPYFLFGAVSITIVGLFFMPFYVDTSFFDYSPFECTTIAPACTQCVPLHCGNVPMLPPAKYRIVSINKVLKMAVHPEGDLVSDNIFATKKPYCSEIISQQLLDASKAGKRLHFLDVGANIGSCSLLAASLGHFAVAVEPMTANHALIRATLELSNFGSVGGSFVLFPVAAANAAQILQIYVEKNNAGNSIVVDTSHPDAVKAIAAFGSFGKEAEYEKPRDVCTVQLDSLMGHAIVRAATLMKVDVQGHEAEALHGMKKLLNEGSLKQAQIELWPVVIKAKGGSFTCESIGKIVYAAGFRVFLENGLPAPSFSELCSTSSFLDVVLRKN